MNAFIKDESGQAMAEYAIVIFFLMAGLFEFVPKFINALQNYYDNYYLFLNLPIP